MRIGIDARLYRSSAAGIGRYSQNLIKNLLALDKANEYVLFMTEVDAEEFEKSKYQISNVKSNPNIKVKITDIAHYSIAEQTKLSRIIERENLDVMHFLNFNHPVRYKGKFIVTIHDLTLLFYPEAAKKTNFIKQAAFKYVFGKACQNAARIIAVSKNTKNDIVKTFNIGPEKVAVIYEATEGKMNATSKIPSHISNIPIILYVGQYREHKNVKRLLDAYKILKKRRPCRLVLVGNIPEEYRKLIDNDPELRDTKTPGFVSDEELSAWYKKADVFVFPSLYEGFGLPGLEAMQAGLPVVSSNRSSLPEIYQDAALYFDPLKPNEIADKIEMVLTDNKIKNNLIAKGAKIAKSFSWERAAQETLAVYRQLIN